VDGGRQRSCICVHKCIICVLEYIYIYVCVCVFMEEGLWWGIREYAYVNSCGVRVQIFLPILWRVTPDWKRRDIIITIVQYHMMARLVCDCYSWITIEREDNTSCHLLQ